MATTIITKFGSGAPAASDVVRGELAVDTENGRLYTENSSGSVVEIGLKPSGNVDVTGTVTADGLTVDGNATITTADNNAQLTVVSTDADASVGPRIDFYRNSGSPANGDLLGEIQFQGEDSIGALNIFATISAKADQVDNGAEDGSLRFKTLINGSLAERLIIDAAGNVGIGSTSPAELITLDKSSGDTFVRFDKSGTIKGLVGISDSSASGSSSAVAGDIILRSQTRVLLDTGGTTRAVVNASGNVGIGTASPSSRLTVSGAFDATSAGSKPSITGAGNYGGGIGFIDTNVSGMYTDTSGANLKFFTNQSSSDTAASKVAMTIDGSSNLLVGRTSTLNAGQASILGAASKQALTLQVTSDGNSLIQGFDSSGNLEFQVTGGGAVSTGGQLSIATTGAGNSLGCFLNQGTGSNFYEASDGTKTMIAGTDGSQTFVKIGSLSNHPVGLVTNNTERVHIDTSGNVGIGTTPASELHVKGATPDLRVENTTASETVSLSLIKTATKGFSINNKAISGTNFLTFNLDTAGAGTDAMVIHPTSGNVGIGSTTVDRGKLHVNHIVQSSAGAFSDPHIALSFSSAPTDNDSFAGISYATSDSDNYGWTVGAERTSGGVGDFIFTQHNNSATGSEKARFDSSGNLLVGQTTGTIYNQTSVTGLTVAGSGFVQATATGATVLYVNRVEEGQIVGIYEAGAAAGGISSYSDTIQFGQGNVYLQFSNAADTITPANGSGTANDDAIDLGSSSARFDDIFATNGTIQTSDRNEKQDIEALTDAEQRVAVACKGLLRKFRWKSAVTEKGDDARIHFGIIAQDLQAAFEAEGLDAGRYAMFINSTWTDEETGEERSRMGVRYSELLAFIIAAI